MGKTKRHTRALGSKGLRDWMGQNTYLKLLRSNLLQAQGWVSQTGTLRNSKNNDDISTVSK